MTCAKCGKQPVEKTIALRTRPIGDFFVVEEKRQALICECGILAWDPRPAPALNPYWPPITYPFGTSGRPNTAPSTPSGTATPPPQLPYITC